MATPFVIIGSGGLGREAHDIWIADAAGLDFLGFVSSPPADPELMARKGTRWLGPEETLFTLPTDVRYVIGVGQSLARQRIDIAAQHGGYRAVSLIHPESVVGADVVIGDGSIVPANCTITTDVRIGRSACLNPGVVVTHDCRLGHYVSVGPNAAICGRVSIGDRVQIGASAVVAPDITIGDDAVVGAGAAVVNDVEAGSTVVGVPARPL